MPVPLTGLLVKPASGDCNLECTYCFYRCKVGLYPDTRVHRMSPEVLEQMVVQYLAMAPQANFCWQGGEPTLMGLDFFKTAVELMKRHGRNGQAVSNCLQTNGVLLDDAWAAFLIEYRFLLGLSLDGPREFHDRYRRTVDGRGSYDRVMAAVDLLRAHQVEFNILVVIEPHNVTEPETLYDFFVSHDLRFLQFIPCIEPDATGRHPAEFSVTPEQYATFLERLFDRWYNGGYPEVSIRDFDEWLSVYMGHPAQTCMFRATCGDYVVVEHNGDIYACDFQVEPQWRYGNIMEQPLEQIIRTPAADRFLALKPGLGDACRQCPWVRLCHGGCVRHRVVLGGSATQPSYFCRAYQEFFAYADSRFRQVADNMRSARPRAPVPSTRPTPSPARPPKARPIGRNSPCPCGSGRKYKHCCGARRRKT